MSRASILVVGFPITRCRAAGLGLLDTSGTRIRAALAVREPKVAVRPSGATTRVFQVRRVCAGSRRRRAAAVTSRARAVAASRLAGPYSELTELEPPVYWLPLRRASASGIRTSARRASSSSAVIIATAVVMPWPTSTRGSRTTTWLAAVTSRTSISSSVPVTRTSEAVVAQSARGVSQPSGAATVRVAAASVYTMSLRRDGPAAARTASLRSKRGLLSVGTCVDAVYLDSYEKWASASVACRRARLSSRTAGWRIMAG